MASSPPNEQTYAAIKVRVCKEQRTCRASFGEGLTMTSACATSTASTLCPTPVFASTSAPGVGPFFSLSSAEDMEPVKGLSVSVPGVETMAELCCSAGMALSLSDHLPVGVSSVNSNIAIATPVIRTNGTMKDTRQATCGVRPRLCTLYGRSANDPSMCRELLTGSRI